ncbi:MAG: COP23 domain-containing protein [Xenococcaceae cyanobacterium]
MHKYISSLLASTVLFSTSVPAWGYEKVADKITFSCEKQNGVPTTVAKNSNDELQPIFHWKRDAFPDGAYLPGICARVSTLLNKYFAQGNNPHFFKLLVTVESDRYYIACLMGNNNDCSVMLFPIVLNTNYSKALITLKKTLDDKFQEIRRIDHPERCVLFIRTYIEINLFNDKS